jgi:uncharacterized membrane protein/thiol-disulfide isomerase/thioredoxin
MGAMRKVAPILVLRLALLVAVFACAVLLVEYENTGDPAFCGPTSGCMAVRHSPYSVIAGIHLPLLGLCAEGALLVLALVASDRSQTFFVAVAAAAGAAVAVGLIGVQAFQIGAFCKWCLLVDLCTIVAAGAAALVHLGVARDPEQEEFVGAFALRRGQIVAWALGAAVVVGLPFLWGEYPVVPPLPAEVAKLAVPGKATIVAFTDFECPFCRKLAPVVHEVQDNWGDRVALVRKMAPLSQHPGAMPAALAFVCTPEAQRDDMATKLYTASPSVLTRDGVKILARDLHLDEGRFTTCLDGPAGEERVAADKALFDALALHSLPYTFVGSRAVAGYNPAAVRKFGSEVMAGDRPSLPLWWMVAAAFVVAVGLAAVTVRLAPAYRLGIAEAGA